MPKHYRRRNRRKRTTRRYKRFAYGAVGAYYGASLATGLYNIRHLLNVEKKNFDTELTNGTLPGTTGAIQQLTNIPIGDTVGARDGNQCKLISVYIRGNVRQNASATQTVCRFMLVLDKQTNGAIYTLAQLLNNVTADDNVVSPLNLDNMYRFIVLWDKVITLSDTGSTVKFFKFYKKLDLKLRFDAAAGTIADLTTNSLSIVRIGDEATNLPTVTYSVRLRFVDN